MNVIAITGEKQCTVVERPDPKIADDFVRIRIAAIPMCTEFKAFQRGSLGDALGHEAVGEVVEVAQAGTVQVGDRVVAMPMSPCGTCWLCLRGEYIHCQNPVDIREACGSDTGTATYAEYCVRKDWQLIPVPDRMSYDHASMACCGLGPTFGAMQKMSVMAYDTVVITGMGPVGLGGVINGLSRGARVVAVEPHPYRRELASDLGAALVIDPASVNSLDVIMDFTDGLGAGKLLDCSGAETGQRLVIDAARRTGDVAFVGEAGELKVQVSNDLIRKGLTLHGSWHYNLADVPRIMDVIAGQAERIDQLITHRFPAARVQEAWELQCTGNCGKVILTTDVW